MCTCMCEFVLDGDLEYCMMYMLFHPKGTQPVLTHGLHIICTCMCFLSLSKSFQYVCACILLCPQVKVVTMKSLTTTTMDPRTRVAIPLKAPLPKVARPLLAGGTEILSRTPLFDLRAEGDMAGDRLREGECPPGLNTWFV